jgi:uncharacterized glyoxalase superfamily protein PhnB
MKNYDFVEKKKNGDVKIVNFNAESAIAYIKEMFSGEVTKMRKKAEAFVVTDQATMNTAIEMTNQAKKLVNKIEKERKRIKAPYLKFTKALDGMSKNLKDPIAEITAILNEKIKPMAEKIQRAEEERLRKEREARLAAEAEADRKRAAGEVVIDVPEVPTVPDDSAAEGRFQTAEGSAKIEYFYTWDVVDFDAVPRKYKKWIIDEDKLDADIQAGIEVKGVHSQKDSKLSTRVKR